jgi:large subunit ribosomal protein L6
MSRVGKKPIEVASGVTVTIDGIKVSAKGALGELSLELPEGTAARLEDGNVCITRSDDTRRSRSFHGLARSLVANMIEGVSKGFKKELRIQGVGFKAELQGGKVLLSLGFASAKEFTPPAGVTVAAEGGTRVIVSGVDKQAVGDTAARIRAYYPAEPYKGKGIRYAGEHVRRKVGKTVA